MSVMGVKVAVYGILLSDKVQQSWKCFFRLYELFSLFSMVSFVYGQLQYI